MLCSFKKQPPPPPLGARCGVTNTVTYTQRGVGVLFLALISNGVDVIITGLPGLILYHNG